MGKNHATIALSVMHITDFETGFKIPTREFSCDKVQLFLYNAVLFNAHLIHYNYEYATEVEGYPDLVVAGPLIGDWLHQCLDAWLGDAGRVLSMEYSNRRAAYIDEVFTGVGTVSAVNTDDSSLQIELSIRNTQDEIIAPGTAMVRLGA